MTWLYLFFVQSLFVSVWFTLTAADKTQALAEAFEDKEGALDAAQVGLHSLPGVRLVTWTITAAINWCC
jgi:hypothetical protein